MNFRDSVTRKTQILIKSIWLKLNKSSIFYEEIEGHVTRNSDNIPWMKISAIIEFFLGILP